MHRLQKENTRSNSLIKSRKYATPSRTPKIPKAQDYILNLAKWRREPDPGKKGKIDGRTKRVERQKKWPSTNAQIPSLSPRRQL